MSRFKVKGAPNKIGVEWDYKFPDEVDCLLRLSTFSPVTNDCLEGEPYEVYHEVYPIDSCDFVVRLCTQITDAYNSGILNTDLSCREYFFKYLPDFIEVREYRK